MKTLYLLRHAKALQSSPDGDKGRKLAPKGLDDCDKLGALMQQKNYLPDLALCSPATRTCETLAGISEHLGTIKTDYQDVIYSGSAGDLLSLIQDSDDSHASIIMVGHNPTLHELAARLCSEDSPASTLNRLSQTYKPAALAVLQCPVQCWNDLQLMENELADLQEPLDYNAPQTPARWT